MVILAPTKKQKAIKLSNYLDSSTIVFLEANDRDEALLDLVNVLDNSHKLPDKQAFLQAIHNREKIVSTGIGMGVAVPHAKLDTFEDFFIAVGIQIKEKGIEWDALDGFPVRLIFMIGGPEHKQTKYLQILSNLTGLIKNEDKRKKLLRARSPQEVIHIFNS